MIVITDSVPITVLTVTPTLFEAQVRDFVDGGALLLHEGVELIEEELLFGVREPAALAAGLHAAHHVLLRAGQGEKIRAEPWKNRLNP